MLQERYQVLRVEIRNSGGLLFLYTNSRGPCPWKLLWTHQSDLWCHCDVFTPVFIQEKDHTSQWDAHSPPLSLTWFSCTDLIVSFLFELSRLLASGARAAFCLLQSCPWWDFCILLSFMHLDISLKITVSPCATEPSQLHTHMGLVKVHSNPEGPESRGSLGLGPLQLAAGSPDSNNRVASQLQGTAKLFPQRSQIGGKWVIMGSEIGWMITALQTFK